ncbi:monovalent cation/H(+) antiporter subunit G [Pararhizobium haloflavum]|uniref:monovalent cation/H(+) antiporter subunit G n=1 Tax=Pararhizobium haloflavum TaxID=2037914 RepID=UPI000C174355|nr:monovalent cation/H(+) antiporter subunit G [Pararhizobium haloflavum]
MILVLSILLKLAGVVFLVLAALGVMRFSDPFQRMHAATKAGTLGAGLVVAGAIVAQGEVSATITGALTIVFLLLSAPIAGHLLGRAAYVSGARLTLGSKDALAGVLERASTPLDERLHWSDWTVQQPCINNQKAKEHPLAKSEDTENLSGLNSLERVRLALIYDGYEVAAPRAYQLAKERGLSLSVRVLIDAQSVETAEHPQAARQRTRQRVGDAMHGFQRSVAGDHLVELAYDEGDPEELLACRDQGETLLVLPHRGWFHHGLEVKRPLTTWTPDGLLRLPSVHAGPVLYCAAEKAGSTGSIAICDRGEAHLPALLDWAIESELWPDSEFHYVGTDPVRFQPVLERHRLSFVQTIPPAPDHLLPPALGHARAAIVGATPRPLRTEWFGMHWHSRFASTFGGEILVQEAQRDRS